MGTTEQWYVTQRAEALTRVLLTRRNDLTITSFQDEDHGVDYRVEITPQGQATGRIFGIQVKARVQALQEKALVPGNYQAYDESIATFPVCLFYFTMEDNKAYYRWIIEPVVTENQTPKLVKPSGNTLTKLNSDELNTIINQVNTWYDRLLETLTF